MNIKNIQIRVVVVLLAWVIGAMFGLIGIVGIFSRPISSIFAIIAALVILPPVSAFIKNKYNIYIARKWRVVMALVAIFLMGTFAPHNPSASNSSSKVDQEQQKNIVQDIKDEQPLSNATTSANETKVSTYQVHVPPTNKTEDQSSSQLSYKYYSVISIVDGDTVKVNINGTVETLRLIGIDTPETVDPRKPVQCFGKEASNKAKELLSGKKVRIEKDVTQGERDKYNRLLAYIYREDELFYNKYMIEQGYAHEYTYSIPYKYQTEFKAVQKSAETSKVGLWSPDTCNGDTTTSTQTKQSTSATNETSDGKFYTSSHYSSKYYYPESCDPWKDLSPSNLKSFNTLEELLKAYPNRTKSPQCN